MYYRFHVVTLQQGLASEGGGAGASRLERELRSPRIPLGRVAALVLLSSSAPRAMACRPCVQIMRENNNSTTARPQLNVVLGDTAMGKQEGVHAAHG